MFKFKRNHCLYYSDLGDMMTNVAEQMNKSVREYMSDHGFNVWSGDQQKMLTGQITQLSSEDHPVYRLMGKTDCLCRL